MVAGILGLSQYRIKRLLAYSSIGHVGYLLISLTVQSTESIEAIIFYIMQYSFTNVNIFFIVILFGYILSYYLALIEKNKKDSKEEKEMENSPIQLITQLNGYFQLNPLLGLSLAVTIYSFMGIPPLIGFFAKQLVLSAAISSGYFFLAIASVITSGISAVYYLGVVNSTFTKMPEIDELISKINYIKEVNSINPKEFESSLHLILSWPLTISVSVMTLIILLYIINPHIWLSSANIIAIILSYQC